MVKRIRPAKNYQRKDAPIRLIAQHAKAAVKRDLKSAFKHLGEMVPVAEVARMIRHGQHPSHAIKWGHYREILKVPFNRLAQVHHAGAALGVRKINGVFAQRRRKVRFHKDVGGRFNFDTLDANTQNSLRQQQDELIQQLEQDARDTIDLAVIDGVSAGLSAEEIAANIRDVIGLTDTQAQAVMNYERMLTELDSGALARQLRNTEYDAAVQDAIDSGADLSDAAISSMVADYTENYLDYRAATIAQTESTRAANEGLHDAYSQAVDRGALPDDAVTREWQVDLDEVTCQICLSIPDNNPNGVGLDEDFDSDDGPIDDPPVHPNAVFAGSLFVPYGRVERMVTAEYDGPAITLLAGDHQTTIGPNHPMFTSRGMVKAKFLKVGDNLVYDRRIVQSTPPSTEHPNLNQVPLIEDAFRALDMVFSHARIAAASDDLHGDVVFCKNEVDVIFPKRKLLFELDAFGLENFRELGFDGTDVKLSLVSDVSFSAEQFERLYLPASGGISGSGSHYVLLPIQKIVQTTFKGAAFDCTTPTSLYCSDGFVVSNCRCSVEYVTDLTKVPDEESDNVDDTTSSDSLYYQ